MHGPDAYPRRAALVALLVSAPAWAGASAVAAQSVDARPDATPSVADRGLEIMEAVDSALSDYGDFTAALVMTLRDGDGAERRREMRVSMLEVPGDGDKTLVVFERPADLRGTSILTIAHRDGSSERWLHLPAIRRTRRIASSDQSDAFMGSELTYEDLGSQDPVRFRHRYLGDETREGSVVHVVERVPTDPASGYARQVVRVAPGAWNVLQIDYFDGADEPFKTLVLEGFRAYASEIRRPDRMVMTNHRTGAVTTLEWRDYAFRVGLTDRDFDPRRLGGGR